MEYGGCPDTLFDRWHLKRKGRPTSAFSRLRFARRLKLVVRAAARRERVRAEPSRVLAAQRLEPSMEPTPPAAASHHLSKRMKLDGFSTSSVSLMLTEPLNRES
jgi:hypothetical protein